MWHCYVTDLHAYDFVIKDFVIKRGCYLCWTRYFLVTFPQFITPRSPTPFPCLLLYNLSLFVKWHRSPESNHFFFGIFSLLFCEAPVNVKILTSITFVCLSLVHLSFVSSIHRLRNNSKRVEEEFFPSLQGHYAKWNKPVTKRQILYDSTYVRCLEWSNS